jgi:hypothetical protein
MRYSCEEVQVPMMATFKHATEHELDFKDKQAIAELSSAVCEQLHAPLSKSVWSPAPSSL